MKIFTYNFFCRPEWSFEDNQKGRIALFEESFVEYQEHNGTVDIVFFQELFDNNIYKHMKDIMFKIGFVYRTNRPNKKLFLNGGSAIFSKFPIMTEDIQTFNGGNIFNAASAKGFNYIKILNTNDNKTYHLVNHHLDSFSPKQRIKQMKMIFESLRKKYISPLEPVIIGGDWNIDMDSNEINNVKAIFKYYDIAEKRLYKNNQSKNHTIYQNNEWVRRTRPVNKKDKKENLWIDFFIYKNVNIINKMEVVQLKSTQVQRVNKIIYSTPFYFDITNPFSKKNITDLSDHYGVCLQI